MVSKVQDMDFKSLARKNNFNYFNDDEQRIPLKYLEYQR